MAHDKSPPVLWGEYLAARLAAAAITSFDADATQRVAAALGRRMYDVDRRHRDRATAHLRMAFPDASRAWLEATARASFEHLTQLAVEVCHTPRAVTLDAWPERAKLGSLGPALRLLNAGRPVILVTGHVGNWEVLGYLLATLGYDIDALARPLDNRLINDWLLGIRERRGMRIITKWDAADRMVAVLERGGALAFIADQNAGERGVFVPFLNRLASSYKSIALLAMRMRVPVVCGYAHRVGPGYRFELGCVDTFGPEDWEAADDPMYYITARYVRAIETMVRMRPDQYLWMHRRWKSRPKFEREGNDPPQNMLRKLESLPWMDEKKITEVLQPVTLYADDRRRRKKKKAKVKSRRQ